jgi:hypothetical protein
MNLSQLSVSLGSVAKLVAKDPLLGQGGEGPATGHGRGGSKRSRKSQISSGIAATRTTPVALRDRRRCAPHPLS